jgi:glycosyltransferase involved in cell wall biosynthesis
MRILILAPFPFYQDRGTPIALVRIVKALSERGDQEIDVITYHEGREVIHDHVTVHRIPAIPFTHCIRPGFSWKKIICDVFMFFKAVRFASRKHYHLVHAVEESVFMALVLKWLFKIPYIYDMDSSLTQQMVEQYRLLTPFIPLLNFFEGLAVKSAKVVVPVCEVLADAIKKNKPGKVVVLQDVSLLKVVHGQNQDNFNLRTELGISGLIIMYIGNLETYQGIDLLLASFSLVLKKTIQTDLVIIGGQALDMQKYQRKACQLGIQQRVHFLGPKPVEYLAAYLAEADILVSPRIKGNLTPSKLYSYLHSGKVILATDLPSHTELLNSRIALLAGPTPEAFSEGMLRLINDETLRVELGTAGKMLIEEKYTYTVFCGKLNGLYEWLEHAKRSERVDRKYV